MFSRNENTKVRRGGQNLPFYIPPEACAPTVLLVHSSLCIAYPIVYPGILSDCGEISRRRIIESRMHDMHPPWIRTLAL